MLAKFEHKGKWKVPESNTWLDGTLSFDPDIGAKLEVFGSFNSFPDRSSKDIILGKTIDGDITLVDVWYSRTTSSPNDIIIAIYQPVIIIIGHHFKTESEICFRQIKSEIFNSFQWFDKSGFENDFENVQDGYSISYNKIAPIPFMLNDYCSGNVSFSSPVTLKDINNEINLKERAFFCLNYSVKTSYKEILNDLRYILGFITLFTFEQSYPMSITFYDDDYSNKFKNTSVVKQIQCIYQNSSYNSSFKVRRPHEHLVKYSDIKHDFPEILKNWYYLFNGHKSVFNLMLSGFRRKNFFSVEKFIDVIKAIETFHRNTQNNQRIPENEYNNLVSSILLNSKLQNSSDKEWLKNKLKGNEPTLKNRLKDLIEDNQNNFIIENISDLKGFYFKVIEARNYYTHYDKSSEVKALKGIDLFKLTSILQGLLYSSIFKELRLKEEHFEKGLKYHLSK